MNIWWDWRNTLDRKIKRRNRVPAHIADKTQKNTKNVALSENQSWQTKDLMDTIDILLFFLDSENQPMSHKREGKYTQRKLIKIRHELIFNQTLLFISNYISDHSNQTYCFHMWLSYITFSFNHFLSLFIVNDESFYIEAFDVGWQTNLNKIPEPQTLT